MSLLKPFSRHTGLNTANILVVENEEQFQQKLADTVVLQEKTVNVNVRLARSLPLPMENEESRATDRSGGFHHSPNLRAQLPVSRNLPQVFRPRLLPGQSLLPGYQW